MPRFTIILFVNAEKTIRYILKHFTEISKHADSYNNLSYNRIVRLNDSSIDYDSNISIPIYPIEHCTMFGLRCDMIYFSDACQLSARYPYFINNLRSLCPTMSAHMIKIDNTN
jgi:hypothetical protein